MQPQPMDTFQTSVESMTRTHLEPWLAMGDADPPRLAEYSPRQKRDNERNVQRLLEKGPDMLARWEGMSPDDRRHARRRIRAVVRQAVVHADEPDIAPFMDACEHIGESFAAQARAFDPAISIEDVFQALRNQWVFNSIQHYLDQPATLTSASFAYSMLYPYTDNALDGTTGGHDTRAAFIDWLSMRLQGIDAASRDSVCEPIGRLLAMIETQFPRATFPEVHHSLLAIHRAQSQSVELHHPHAGDMEEDLLAITIAKGGTSVLADGFLVTGTLPQGAQEAMFSYGVLLQLIDDLEDLDEDGSAGHSSPFIRAERRGTLEGATNRLFRYAQWCIERLHRGAPPEKNALCALIGRSCRILTLEAVARHQRKYSPGYLRRLEAHMPFDAGFFGRLKETVVARAGGPDVWSIALPQAGTAYRPRSHAPAS